MSDNLAYNPNGSASVAADDIAGVHYQRVKIGVGADGSATDLAFGQAVAALSLPVVLASDKPLPSPNTAIAAATVTVTTSATALPSSALSNRRRITVQNRDSAASLYLGPSGVTTSSGLEVLPYATYTLELGASVTLYGISTTSINVRVFEAA